jgi:hypothetical protein
MDTFTTMELAIYWMYPRGDKIRDKLEYFLDFGRNGAQNLHHLTPHPVLRLLPILTPHKLTRPTINPLPQDPYRSTLQSDKYSPLNASPSVPTAACTIVLDPISAVRPNIRTITRKKNDGLCRAKSVRHSPGFTLTSAPRDVSGLP